MTMALAQAGADIVLVQRASSSPNYETRDQIKALGRRVEVVECDLADKTQVRGLCKKVTGSESEGGLGLVVDIVVNCGGIQRRTPAENFPDEDWEEVSRSYWLLFFNNRLMLFFLIITSQVLQVNLSTVFTISRDFGAHMLSTRGGISGQPVPSSSTSPDYDGRGRGKIINVGSLLNYQGGLTVPAYAAAKHGVAGIVGHETAVQGTSEQLLTIRINSVTGQGHVQRMGFQGDQHQLHRPRIHRDGYERGSDRQSDPIETDHGTYSRSEMGIAQGL
jgi:2-deoxy-D-gluconate 3-dehydrogenase